MPWSAAGKAAGNSAASLPSTGCPSATSSGATAGAGSCTNSAVAWGVSGISAASS
eukprot:CAMPEP_0175616118 /NCGR_PEP_ID=MMETSP0096-20121207/65716_1 /TAXON_ID=311494 /ORGANISM="Alexandrium monilatum, Strain CCMP3105" /LENGTH=54 /DNA_ID=CAMNT_0016921269 /DNA_START=32 /DNA_END=192 /DNA_ORIENTATION=-